MHGVHISCTKISPFFNSTFHELFKALSDKVFFLNLFFFLSKYKLFHGEVLAIVQK